MAITFKEQSTGKKSFTIDKFSKVLIIIIGILLFAFVALFLYKWTISAAIKDTQNKIQDVNTKRDVLLEKEMKESLEKFQKAKLLLSSHKNGRGIFTFLEQNTYQGVTLSSFEANLKDNTLSFNISSAVPQNLAVQIAAFRQANLGNNQKAVSSVEVGSFSIDDKGTVTLRLKLTLNQAIIKF